MTVSSSIRATVRPLAADLANADERLGIAIEERLDAGAPGAGADERRVRASAANQQQRVDQQRLAGAGLAGDRREPGPERDARPRQDGEVGDGELQQRHRSA